MKPRHAKDRSSGKDLELVVNYHLTRHCNYACRHCYSVWNPPANPKELHRDPHQTFLMLENVRKEIPEAVGRAEVKSLRLNLVGGEPTIPGSFGKIVEAASKIGYGLGLVTNGTRIDEAFVERYAAAFHVIGVSVDAVDPKIMRRIGRADRKGRVLDLDRLCRTLSSIRAINPAVQIKINTVVNRFNFEHDMNGFIDAAAPDKWKVLQVLPNVHPQSAIGEGQFRHFLKCHRRHENRIYAEDNDLMENSYIMIDPWGRFFNNIGWRNRGGYAYSPPICSIGAGAALSAVGIDLDKFCSRYRAPKASPLAA